jgi:hypothetical protein
VADPLRRAVLRIQRGRSLRQLLELAAELLKLPDARIEVGGVAAQQVGDVATRCLPVVAEGDDLADLPQGQANRLRGADEPEPSQAASS